MSTERESSREQYAAAGRILREAADVDSLRDFAESSWQEAMEQRGQSRRRGLVTVLVAAVAAVLAVALLPGSDLERHVPAGPTDEGTTAMTSAEIFRFVPQGDVTLGDRDPAESVPATELVGTTWSLQEVTSSTAPLADVIGSSTPTVLTFPPGQEGTMVLEIGDCGRVIVETAVKRFGGHQVEAVEVQDQGCPAGVQQAGDYWAQALTGHRVRLTTAWEAADDDLFFSVMVPQSEESGAEQAPEQTSESTPLGGGLSLALPQGWQSIYQGARTEGTVTTCLVPEGGATDPTQACTGVTVTSGLTEQTRPGLAELLTGDVSAVACHPDQAPSGANGEQLGDGVTVGAPETGTVQAGPFRAEWHRWEGECTVDGAIQRFRLEAWWIRTPDGGGALATSVSAQEGILERRLDLGSVLDGIDTDPEGLQPVMLDARVQKASTDRLLLTSDTADQVRTEEGVADPSPTEYTLTERTRCLLHDVAAEPGVGLHLAPCVDVTDWFTGEITAGGAPTVRIVTDQEQRLLQVYPVDLP